MIANRAPWFQITTPMTRLKPIPTRDPDGAHSVLRTHALKNPGRGRGPALSATAQRVPSPKTAIPHPPTRSV